MKQVSGRSVSIAELIQESQRVNRHYYTINRGISSRKGGWNGKKNK